MKKKFLSIALLVVPIILNAQSLPHPTLYATDGERQQVLDKISNNTWASSLVKSMKSNVDPKITTHTTNPASIFSTVETIPANDGNSESYASPYASAHGKVLTTASYSAMLYYITQDEKYASFAADILAYYFDLLSARTEMTTTITGAYFYDARTTYNHLAVAYDFMYDYLKTPGIKVYKKSTNTRVAYDHAKAQKVIRNIAARTLNEAGGLDVQGKVISNHPVLTAPGSLFSILCVEDDTERERLFNLFWDRGTKRQNSFTKTILNMFTEQSLWPESVSYGFMPNVQLILNLVDKINPSLNAGPSNKGLFESASLFENLRLPNRTFVRYGDSHRMLDGTGDLNRYALNFAKRRGLSTLQKQAEVSLKQSYPTSNGYSTSVPSGGFENYNALELFWGEPLPAGSVSPFDYKPTVVIKHAGVALQRNYSGTDDKEYGLVGIIGGAHYVHSHLTGITMELYGSGDVMGPNGGLPPTLSERSTMPFQGHLNRHSGNNTVIVNGTSRGAAIGWGSDKLLYQDTTKNISAEPKHLEAPISKHFSFATQFLDDNVNNCDQQRTLSTIRTSATTAYYLDIFRSKSNGANNFHDYIYHNIGDATKLTNTTNQDLSVSATKKYQTDIGDAYESPGWKTFEQTKSTAGITDAVKIRFDLTATNRYMHMLVPGGVTREYTKALGPATYEALNGYEDKKTQVVAIRQNGEAWNKPFVSVFEPSKNVIGSVKSVENLYTGSKIVGAKVISDVSGNTIADYLIVNENNTDVYTLASPAISFKGRFAVVRVESDSISLYIGEGVELQYGTDKLTASTNKNGVKVIYPNIVTPPTNQAPTVSFTAPANSASFTLGDMITLKTTASDADGSIAKVNFLINDAFYKTVTNAPYEDAFTPAEAGVYKVTARAIDNDNSKTDISINITVVAPVVKLAPTVTLESPVANSTFNVGEEILLQASANDADGNVTKVNFKINDTFHQTVGTAPFDGSFTPAKAGTYKIAARVFDNDDLQTEVYVTVNVESPSAPPTVAITSPADNAVFNVGETISIKATAGNPDNSIEKVNFKINDAFYKTATTEPYEKSFVPNEPGFYKIAARAFDNDELQTEAYITVEVIASSSSSSSNDVSTSSSSSIEQLSSSSTNGASSSSGSIESQSSSSLESGTGVFSTQKQDAQNVFISHKNGKLYVHSRYNGNSVVRIYNNVGTQVNEVHMNVPAVQIDLTALNAGIYFVQVSNKGRTLKQQVITLLRN